MSSDLSDIVQVVITDESTAIATASFNIPLVLSTFTNFPERTRTYNSITDVGSDFATTDKAFIMASQAFGQSSVIGAPPPSIVIGRRQVDTVTYTPTVTDNTAYIVTLNGTPYTFTSGVGATATTIVTGLKAAIGSPTGITVGGTVTLTLTTTVIGSPWSVKASVNLVGVNTATETWPAALLAVDTENDIWFCLTAETQVTAEQKALSDLIQSMDKVYGLSSSDAVALTTGTADIGYVLNAASAAATFGVYLGTAATEYPEVAWVGSQLAVTPGGNDWDLKQAVGVTRSILTPTQITNLRSKSWNFYRRKGGVDIFQDGNMFNGKPIDTYIGKAWLKARLQEGVYFRLINSLKVPLTDPGLLIIENEIRAVLSQAESNGLIDRGWSVQTPPVSSIPANLRAQRAAGVFVINARLQGSVRSVSIQVFLSV